MLDPLGTLPAEYAASQKNEHRSNAHESSEDEDIDREWYCVAQYAIGISSHLCSRVVVLGVYLRFPVDIHTCHQHMKGL